MVLLAQDQSENPPGKRLITEDLFFSQITLSNDAVSATMPLAQTRFRSFLNGTNTGFAAPNQVFILKSDDKLELVEKHTTITVVPLVTSTNAELRIIKVFDARSFGDSVTTNVGTIKLK